MILGMLVSASMHTMDTLFLGWHSKEALAASMPAGLTAWTMMVFFVATAGYVGTFAAQHHGAGEHTEAGAMVWPAMLIAAIGGIISLIFIVFRVQFFAMFQVAPAVFDPLCTLGAILLLTTFPSAGMSALIGFFCGVGRTWIALVASIAAFFLNAWLAYGLIFGALGLPEWGVKGSAIATLITSWLGFFLLLWLFLSPWGKSLGGGYTPMTAERLRRFCRFALPHGSRDFAEILSWQAFTVIVARFGETALAANNIAIRVTLLCFIPMVGLGQAIGIAVGHRLSTRNPESAHRTALIGMWMAITWAAFTGAIFLFLPGAISEGFLRSDEAQRENIRSLAIPLFWIAAVWGFGDAITLSLRGALSGAGDTRWPFLSMLVTFGTLMVLPLIILAFVWKTWGLSGQEAMNTAWIISLITVMTFAGIMMWRFHAGHWRGMSVRK